MNILPWIGGHIIGRVVKRIRPFAEKVDEEEDNEDTEDGQSYAT